MSSLSTLRVYNLIEGVSYLGLLVVAMPLKYVYGMPLAVRVAGGLHGMFFLLFLGALYQAKKDLEKSASWACLMLGVALVPGGTFILDDQLRKELLAQEKARESKR
jgi:integral membrane protein